MIYVAKLGKTLGLKGFQKIYIDSDFPEQFKKGSTLYLNENQKLTIESFNIDSNSIKFVEVNSIDEAKKLTNKHLFITLEDTKKNCNLEDNQYFWFDLIDCKIVENDIILGTIKDIQRLPLSDYFQVETSKELVEQGFAKTFLIPYIDDYIIQVDIENKTITTKNCKDILEAS